jgi:hypothetical protein
MFLIIKLADDDYFLAATLPLLLPRFFIGNWILRIGLDFYPGPF